MADYKNLVDACKNIKAKRMPLYEHHIAVSVMEEILGIKFAHLKNGGLEEKKEFYRHFCGFFEKMGYDTVSIEFQLVPLLINGGSLEHHAPSAINTMDDLDNYPFDEVINKYFSFYNDEFIALRHVMPQGMKAVGGVGYGLFEVVQDLVGYENLCILKYDDEELYKELFLRCGRMYCDIWEKFLKLNQDMYCVCRFGDDLGYSTQTLLPPDDIKEHLMPHYKKVVDMVHGYGKPFIMHSCGKIFAIMDDLIDYVGIDAKHSNEDSICPFSKWIDDYGDRIGNIGGIDTDILCRDTGLDLAEYVTDIYKTMDNKNGGAAIGSGNSIPDYVSVPRYLEYINTVRKLRGDVL